jgi:hypothetical protein
MLVVAPNEVAGTGHKLALPLVKSVQQMVRRSLAIFFAEDGGRKTVHRRGKKLLQAVKLHCHIPPVTLKTPDTVLNHTVVPTIDRHCSGKPASQARGKEAAGNRPTVPAPYRPTSAFAVLHIRRATDAMTAVNC